jgi:hypothetical protein
MTAMVAAITIGAAAEARAQTAATARSPTRAAPSTTAGEAAPESPKFRAPKAGPLPAALAVVPGVLVRGTGHWAAGDRRTAKRLLIAEGIGLGGVTSGLGVMILTGASRRVMTLAAATTGVGFGLLALSLIADVYGASGASSIAANPLRTAPVMEFDLGYRYVKDPLFAYHNMVAGTVTARMGGLKLEPSVWAALDDDNARWRQAAAWRFLGPRPGRLASDGSFVDLETALTTHRYGTERFTTRTVEAAVSGRLDLKRISPTLAGSFAEAGLGWALAKTDYALAGVPSDPAELLLMRFGFGVYLGGKDAGGGELLGFYDHRRDTYAGGLPIAGIGSGVLGHAGVKGQYYIDESLGLGAEVTVGSAWIAGVSLRYRMGVIR